MRSLLAFAIFLAMPALAKPLTVHVTVALCDNATQGIVPVPAAIGDGNDPRTNLYWGASYGVKSQLRREKWTIEKAKPPHAAILERLVARKTIGGREVVLTADAWRGSRIRDAITTFIEHSSGGGEGGSAEIVAYIGHDGLMEFDVAPRLARNTLRATTPRSIVLACASRQYFGEHLRRARSEPLLWTTGLMAPEAYTLTAAVEAWAKTGDPAAVREAAAQAYHKYQKCGIKAARRLFGA